MPENTPPADAQGDLHRRLALELTETDALTPNHDGTPEFYIVDVDNLEYLVATVLTLAANAGLEMTQPEVCEHGMTYEEGCTECSALIGRDDLAARPVPAATHADLVPRHEAAYVTCDHCGAEAAPTQTGMTISCADCWPAVATHTDTAAQAGAQVLRDAVRKVLDGSAHSDECESDLTTGEWDCVCPLNDLYAVIAQAPAPTPGQRTVQVVVYTDEPGPDVTEVEPLFTGGKVATGTGMPWALLKAAHGPLVPVGTRARLRGDA